MVQKVVLSQKAPWNPELANGYRTRYAEVGGRLFRIYTEGLNSTLWNIEEVHFHGNTSYMPGAYYGHAFGLAAVREKLEQFL